jgi:hypothetical protein
VVVGEVVDLLEVLISLVPIFLAWVLVIVIGVPRSFLAQLPFKFWFPEVVEEVNCVDKVIPL